MHKPRITIAGYKSFDRIAALADGRVAVEGCDHTFEKTGIGDANTHVFSGPGTREVTEIGLHPFMLPYANDGFRDYSLLPVFPLRVFRHKSIFIRTDRGITTPADLKGRKVGTPGFSSSSLTWLRGIMEHEYGLKPSDVAVCSVRRAGCLSGITQAPASRRRSCCGALSGLARDPA